MALSNAEKQRRYRERHMMVPRNGHPAIAMELRAVPAPPGGAPDLTEVHAALAEARHVLSNHNPYNATMARQIQSLLLVLERVVEALGGPRGL